MAVEVLAIGERLDDPVDPPEVGDAERQPAPRGHELDVPREHAAQVGEVLDEPDREHQVDGPGLDREEVGVVDRALDAAAAEVLAGQLGPPLAVLDPLDVGLEPLRVEHEPLRRGAADFEHAVRRPGGRPRLERARQ